MREKPKVSIIIATFNRAHLIEETLESITAQKFRNWECLIIDDGSNDSTAAILRPYLEGDFRFKYHMRTKKYKKGISGARNYGLDLAKGDYVIFFDDDDIVHPKNLEVCLSYLENTNFKFCHYKKRSFQVVNPEPTELRQSAISKIGLNQLRDIIDNKIALASCTVMWKKECFNEVRFNEDLMYAEEWECYIRIILNENEGIGINNILYFNRKHENSNTGEFWRNDPQRRGSMVKAVLLVVDHLYSKKVLSKEIIQSIMQKGLFLKERKIIRYVLRKKKVDFLTLLKNELWYASFPAVKILYRSKKRILTLFPKT